MGIVFSDARGRTVWRVGRAPDPWAWVEHQYSGNNRWDDSDGLFRTIYAGDELYACFLEILAFARPDLEDDGSDPLDQIQEDPEDAVQFPVRAAGIIPRVWIGARMVGSAKLSGRYVDVRKAQTIAVLRPSFIKLAKALGLYDFDAAALKIAYPRELTQRITSYLYALTDNERFVLADGINFASRLGDNLNMWAIFERPEDGEISSKLRSTSTSLVDLDDQALIDALAIHHLRLN